MHIDNSAVCSTARAAVLPRLARLTPPLVINGNSSKEPERNGMYEMKIYLIQTI